MCVYVSIRLPSLDSCRMMRWYLFTQQCTPGVLMPQLCQGPPSLGMITEAGLLGQILRA